LSHPSAILLLRETHHETLSSAEKQEVLHLGIATSSSVCYRILVIIIAAVMFVYPPVQLYYLELIHIAVPNITSAVPSVSKANELTRSPKSHAVRPVKPKVKELHINTEVVKPSVASK